jgi:hypothetical protein
MLIDEKRLLKYSRYNTVKLTALDFGMLTEKHKTANANE